MSNQQMPSPPTAPQDVAVRGTMDALNRKGQQWPSRMLKCRFPLDRDKTTRQERFITFTAELQTRRAEQFDGTTVHVVDIEQIIRLHHIEIPEAPIDVRAAGDQEAKNWHRDQFTLLLRTMVGRERIPPGVEVLEERPAVVEGKKR